MSLTSKFNPELCEEILILFQNGESPAKICSVFELSERNYCSILKKYSEKFAAFKEMRLMNQKKNKKHKQRLHLGPVVEVILDGPKITAEERIKILERKLELERKENQQLKDLLDVAKEHLGKS